MPSSWEKTLYGVGAAASKEAFLIIGSLFAVALYNVIELLYLIGTVFKYHKSLYFWSFMVATWGIAINAIGFILKDFGLTTNPYIYFTVVLIGWSAMVTGQSLVLYSRLHLIVYSRKVMRAILFMIVANFFICTVPIYVVLYGAAANHNRSSPSPYTVLYPPFEKMQLTIFFVQELIISSIYMYETVRFLRVTAITRGNRETRGIMRGLLVMSALVSLIDVPILVLEYAGLYHYQTSYKVFAYSVKLKIEFGILNKLTNMSRSHGDTECVQTGTQGTVSSG